MTTVTTSDRGDAGSTRSQRGARSASSDIPGQRAGGAAGAQVQALPLRILVLGASAAADGLRRQAAEAGAELAQRFSARVTHVVTEPGLPADDARVAKALAADLPVLTLDEFAQLMGFVDESSAASTTIPSQPVTPVKKRASAGKSGGKAGAGAKAGGVAKRSGASGLGGEAAAEVAEAGAAKPEGVEAEPTEAKAELAEAELVEAELGEAVESAAEGEGAAGGVVEAELGVAGGVEAEPAEEAFSSTEQLVEAAVASSFVDVRMVAGAEGEVGQEKAELEGAELAEADHVGAEAGAVSPTESMLGTALEAALLFPPLPVSSSESLTLDSDYLIDSYPDAPAIVRSVQPVDRVEQAAFAERSVRVAVGAGVDVGGEADLAGEESAEVESAGDGELIDLVDLIDLDSLDDDDASALSVTDPALDRGHSVASYAWAAVPFASLGLLTPVAMGYAAYRRRSRALAGVAAWYLFAVTIAFAISATAHNGAKTQSAVGDLLTICLAASWIGGTVHALMIRRQVFGQPE